MSIFNLKYNSKIKTISNESVILFFFRLLVDKNLHSKKKWKTLHFKQNKKNNK